MAHSPQVSLTTHRHRGFDCLCGNMRMAARAVTTLYDGHLAPAGLTAAELSVLWCVVSAQPVSMQMISEFLAMEKSTVGVVASIKVVPSKLSASFTAGR